MIQTNRKRSVMKRYDVIKTLSIDEMAEELLFQRLIGVSLVMKALRINEEDSKRLLGLISDNLLKSSMQYLKKKVQ